MKVSDKLLWVRHRSVKRYGTIEDCLMCLVFIISSSIANKWDWASIIPFYRQYILISSSIAFVNDVTSLVSDSSFHFFFISVHNRPIDFLNPNICKTKPRFPN